MSHQERKRVKGAEEDDAAGEPTRTPDPARDERGAKRRDQPLPAKDAARSDSDAPVKAEELNSIRPARMRRRPGRPTGAEATESSSLGMKDGGQDMSPQPLATAGEGGPDPWTTLPQQMRDRLHKDGHRFYFRDGRLAFRDLGRKVTTGSEHPDVVAFLIHIVRSRGWHEVALEGTKRFCRQAWRQGRLAGLVVRGYTPSAAEHAGMIRTLSDRAKTPDARDSSALTSAPAVAIPAVQGDPVAPRSRKGVDELITGTLLVHGLAPHRSNPLKEMSYFIRIDTHDGPRTIWAKDLKRAMEQSRTQPKVGDQIVMRRVPSNCRPVKSQARNVEDPALKEQDRLTRRQGWVIEKRDFFEARAKAAETLRNPAIEPREGVRQHPELAGSYLNLRFAELAARGMRHPENEKKYVEAVRNGLADSIARGDPFPQVRLRGRPEGHSNLERGHPPVRG
jgi:hypothetical protein